MFRTLRRSLLAVAILAGGTLQAAPQNSQTLSMPGYPDVGSPATVTLVSPGNAPRVPLRFKPSQGRKETLLMTTAIGVSLSMEGMSLPAMEMPVMKLWADSVVTGVAANGDITVDVGFTKLQVDAPAGGDSTVAQMMQAAAESITSLKGSMTMTDRGISKSSSIDVEKIADPTMRQTLGAMSGQFENLSMPLPAEPVGVGATWEVRQVVKNSGAVIFQRVECELVSVDARGASVKVKIEQTAPPQSFNNPAMPGMAMNIRKVSGGGTGTMALQFDSLTPTSEITSSTTMDVSMDMGGQMQQVAMQLTMKMSIAPDKSDKK